MPLDPQAQGLCDAINALGGAPASDELLQEARDGLAMLHASGAGPAEDVYAIGDLDADGVPVRVYRPSSDDGLPVVVYFHGGGWTIGSVDVYDPITRALANAANAIVVSVEYRLAPEHPYPEPLDDCWTALEWVTKNTSLFEGDAHRIAVAGDSAGGNLAAVCALMARDAGLPLALQVLIYPATDASMTSASYTDNGEGYLLEAKQMRWFYDCYTAAAPTSPTGTCRRCAHLMSRVSRPRSSSPPSSTRCATKARRTPRASPTQVCQWSRRATTARSMRSARCPRCWTKVASR